MVEIWGNRTANHMEPKPFFFSDALAIESGIHGGLVRLLLNFQINKRNSCGRIRVQPLNSTEEASSLEAQGSRILVPWTGFHFSCVFMDLRNASFKNIQVDSLILWFV